VRMEPRPRSGRSSADSPPAPTVSCAPQHVEISPRPRAALAGGSWVGGRGFALKDAFEAEIRLSFVGRTPNRRSNHASERQGFTLIELMIVVAPSDPGRHRHRASFPCGIAPRVQREASMHTCRGHRGLRGSGVAPTRSPRIRCPGNLQQRVSEQSVQYHPAMAMNWRAPAGQGDWVNPAATTAGYPRGRARAGAAPSS
jgi:hypothetical protein